MSQPLSEVQPVALASRFPWLASVTLTRAFWVAMAVFGGLVLSVSYLDEDAFISFRVIDNFVRGHGLRWNVDERVQVYTHPLWLLLLIPVRLILGNVGAASFALSWVLSVGAFALVAQLLVGAPRVLFVALLLPLLFSQSFTDYTSSGLENPLTFFVLAVCVRNLGTLRLERATLAAAVLALSRPDAILLVSPLVLGLVVHEGLTAPSRAAAFKRLLRAGLVSASPLWLWFAFSLFYYGFPWPNPKYAKLGGGIDTATYLGFGANYVLDILRNDTVTFGGLALGSWLGLRQLAQARGRVRESLTELPFSLRAGLLLCGVVVTTLYLVWIGGDFMAGRHWAAPFFLSIATLATWLAKAPAERQEKLLAGGFIATLVLHFGVQSLLEQRNTIRLRDQDRTAKVRHGGLRVQRYNCGFYEALFGSIGPVSKHAWSQDGIKARAEAKAYLSEHPDSNFVMVDGAAGKLGFFAGSKVTVIDPLGITDPLLARLPDYDGEIRVIGHLRRKVPAGYEEARRSGDMSGMEPHLRNYYERLRLVTSGPLFDSERLSTMLAFQFGEFDEELAEATAIIEAQAAAEAEAEADEAE